MSTPSWWWFASPIVIAYAGIGVHRVVTAVRRRRRPARPCPPASVPPPAVVPQQRRPGEP